MYFNTTYKAFVAETAAKLMTQMVGQAMAIGNISPYASFDENKRMYEHLAMQANSAAYILADHMKDRWSERDHQTSFFDPNDSPSSRIEDELSNIAEQLKNQVLFFQKLDKMTDII